MIEIQPLNRRARIRAFVQGAIIVGLALIGLAAGCQIAAVCC